MKFLLPAGKGRLQVGNRRQALLNALLLLVEVGFPILDHPLRLAQLLCLGVQVVLASELRVCAMLHSRQGHLPPGEVVCQ